jgi:hypothetical protein
MRVNRIRTSAQTWLKSSTYGRNRWAINVEEYIAKNNKSLPALFEFFDADAQTVTEWIEGKRESTSACTADNCGLDWGSIEKFVYGYSTV